MVRGVGQSDNCFYYYYSTVRQRGWVGGREDRTVRSRRELELGRFGVERAAEGAQEVLPIERRARFESHLPSIVEGDQDGLVGRIVDGPQGEVERLYRRGRVLRCVSAALWGQESKRRRTLSSTRVFANVSSSSTRGFGLRDGKGLRTARGSRRNGRWYDPKGRSKYVVVGCSCIVSGQLSEQ